MVGGREWRRKRGENCTQCFVIRALDERNDIFILLKNDGTSFHSYSIKRDILHSVFEAALIERILKFLKLYSASPNRGSLESNTLKF